jgi:predicted membrane-bound spermidine synthase
LRWKLLIAASLLAAAAGAGAFYAAWHFLLTPWGGREAPLWAAAVTLLAPLAAIAYAAVFVYRHNARRRKLQAAATALLASLLALAALTLVPILAGRPAPELLPSPPTRNT